MMSVMPLARSEALRLAQGGNADDLLQAGLLAAARQFPRWNPEHKSGATFATFAWLHVRAAIRREAARERAWLMRREGEPSKNLRATRSCHHLCCDFDVLLSVHRAVNKLPPDERFCVKAYFGIDGRPTLNDEETSKLFGVENSNVWRCRQRALNKLRRMLKDEV